MDNNSDLKAQLECFKNCTFHYTESARKEMDKAHLDEKMLRTKILEAQRIEVESPTNLVISGEKTFKVKIELLQGNDVLVHSISFNKVMFVF
ncbi:hypothetical protein [Lachnoclostridium phytofermentans]|uniref:Uncharacterized protein n=1 Tax=Lachnoclostridium phytofermentans (strain ATCC 700394 / DSM 18823 / ISDg) TaxID=357809 RepID=A9KM38_LACP7|nr:hypothetical protein [Lachnoclostridium phytofermentans]ABX41381.1 hypothetical protein Cphy_1001 [Lachnoclostridium phytofermentans ISDg]